MIPSQEGMNDFESALPVCSAALAAHEAAYGRTHAATLSVMASCAHCMEETGRYEEALDLYQKVRNVVSLVSPQDVVLVVAVLKAALVSYW